MNVPVTTMKSIPYLDIVFGNLIDCDKESATVVGARRVADKAHLCSVIKRLHLRHEPLRLRLGVGRHHHRD